MSADWKAKQGRIYPQILRIFRILSFCEEDENKKFNGMEDFERMRQLLNFFALLENRNKTY